MLHIPENSPDVATICATDPGSDKLGVAAIRFSLTTGDIVSSSAQTFEGAKLARRKPWVSDLFGDRIARVESLGESYLAFLHHEKPFDIASEAPFMGRFPAAFGALVEVISMLRRQVMTYDSRIGFNLIDPPTVKKAVGAPVKGGKEGKDAVAKAIRDLIARGILKYDGETPIEELDEHSNDALAVGICRWMQFRRHFPNPPVI